MSVQIKSRAINSVGSKVGKKRQELYKSAIEWIHCSIAGSNYLEAISLAGSLISDRLESRLNRITGDVRGFRSLPEIIELVSQLEPNEELRRIAAFEVYEWMQSRDGSLHDMVKLEENRFLSWQDRVETNKKIARKGLALFRKIDKKIKYLNKRS